MTKCWLSPEKFEQVCRKRQLPNFLDFSIIELPTSHLRICLIIHENRFEIVRVIGVHKIDKSG